MSDVQVRTAAADGVLLEGADGNGTSKKKHGGKKRRDSASSNGDVGVESGAGPGKKKKRIKNV